jgi:hypothetical protein
MKVNEQRMRIKAIYKDALAGGGNLNGSHSMGGLFSSVSGRRNQLPQQYLTAEERTNTSNEMSVFKPTKRFELNSAFNRNRDAISTRGGVSFAGKSDFYGEPTDPPFLFLNDQESLQRFMTKQRKMVTSVSSKYLNYNPAGKSKREDSPPPGGKLDGVSTIAGENSDHKLNNFNEYQHVYNDPRSNEANVTWIT